MILTDQGFASGLGKKKSRSDQVRTCGQSIMGRLPEDMNMSGLTFSVAQGPDNYSCCHYEWRLALLSPSFPSV
jgi:hypothetical protein